MAETTTYDILTYDYKLGKWTPQKGVRRGPYSKWGVKRALRKLQTMGYDARRGDPSVSVLACPVCDQATQVNEVSDDS